MGDDGKEGIPALEEDLRIGIYEPSATDWPPHGHQDAQCQKLSTLLNEVMTLSVSEAFLVPVDLKSYPEYATSKLSTVLIDCISRDLINVLN